MLRAQLEQRRFVLHNVRPTGRRIGKGSYGTVEEVEIEGLLCAAKKLHEILVERGNQGGQNILGRFVEECSILSELRHPHIVQFLGLCFLGSSDLPVLVMEYLPYCLDSLLEERRVEIPLPIKRSILADVARGLSYLHARPVIHRDLTAKNVLLTEAMMAKIADLGVARILNLSPGRMAATMSQTPGTLSYMPPEALEVKPRYSATIDIFSFGHLALFTIVEDFPYPTAFNRPDPNNPGRVIGLTEVQRRSHQMEQLSHQLGGERHPLVQLVTQCLDNDPSQRPTARQVLSQLEEMKRRISEQYTDMSRLELIQGLKERDKRIQSLQGQHKSVQSPLPGGTQPQQHVQLSIGSTIQTMSDPPGYGVIRWIGELPQVEGQVAGVELEEDIEGACDGTWRRTGVKYFDCDSHRGMFIPLESLKPDERFMPPATTWENHQQQEKIQTESTELWREKEQFKKEAQRLEERLLQQEEETRQLEASLCRQRQELQQHTQRERTLQAQVQQLQGQTAQVGHLQAELERLRLAPNQMVTSQEIEFWKVPRKDVQIGDEIGVGGWGVVAKGVFHGQEVAVKSHHKVLLTAMNVERLRREVRILAKVRHPNLLLFIAAVFDERVDRLEESPMIITELLDTNLRSAYETGRLVEASKPSIVRDVACALNYLHQHQEPIIHRDVSSSNVLLGALPNNKWRAKISGFGAANLAEVARTPGEGAILYCAPEGFPGEAHDPTAIVTLQTTKMDVYSYGVLLCEVITNRMPFPEDYRDMLQQVKRHSRWPFMYDIITLCTRKEPEERPTMADVLTQLDRITR